MEDSLVGFIRQASVKNDTRSVQEFMCLKSKEHLNINSKTLDGLKSIVNDNKDKLHAVNCVVSCVKYYLDQGISIVIWNRLAKNVAGLCIICLNECVSINERCVEEESVLINLLQIVSELLDLSDVVVQAFHNLMVQHILKIIVNKNILLESKYALARILCGILRDSSRENFDKNNPHMQEDVANFTNWILACGDYEIQTTVLEALVYFSGNSNNKEEFCGEWFYVNPQVREEYFKHDFSDFEAESRIFLNKINKLNNSFLVFSIGCIYIFTDGIKLQKPNDSNYLQFWVDFSLCSKCVLIYYQGDSDLWEMLKLRNKDVLQVSSNNGECNLNSRMTPVVKLCFTLSSFDTNKSVNNVEIWFEISEEFCCLENKFLGPVYGYRYQSNWKIGLSLLSNEENQFLSRESNSLDLHSSLLKYYTPLSVVITPSKSQSTTKYNSQKSSYLVETQKVDSSSDEIMPTPEKTIDSHTKKRLKIQKNAFTPRAEVKKCEDNEKDRKCIKKSTYKSEPRKVSINNTNKINQPCDVSSTKNKSSEDPSCSIRQKNLESLVKEHRKGPNTRLAQDNLVQTNSDKIKRKKLFCNLNNGVDCSVQSPLYDSSDKNSQENKVKLKDKKNTKVKPKVSYSYRMQKEEEQSNPSDFENYQTSVEDETTPKKRTRFQAAGRRFFKNKQTPDSVVEPQTPKPSCSAKHSVYSDFSSSSEPLRKRKRTYGKQKSAKNKTKKVKATLHIAPDPQCNVKSGKSNSKTTMSAKYNEIKESYVSRLEEINDPLRFKDKQNETNEEHVDSSEIPIVKNIEQKEVGKTVYRLFDKSNENFKLGNNYIHQEENPAVDVPTQVIPEKMPLLRSKDVKTSKTVTKNQLKSKKQPNLININFKRNKHTKVIKHDFNSDNENQDIQMCTMIGAAISNDIRCSLTTASGKNPRDNIEERDISLRKDTFDEALCALNTQMKRNSTIITEIDKWKNMIEESNTVIKNTMQFIESVLGYDVQIL